MTKGNPTHPRCFLIDVEGTIVLDKSLRPIPGAQEFIGKLVHGQRPYSLVTNFTTDTPADLASRLKSHGFQIKEQHIQSPLSTVIPILKRMNVQTVYTIGTPALKDYLINNGIQSHEEPTVDAVVVGLDTEVDYHKLKVACQAIVHHKAVLVGLHRGRIYDDEHGETAPSVGTIVAALEWATQEHAITVGKPSQAFFKLALEWLDASPGECVMISRSLYRPRPVQTYGHEDLFCTHRKVSRSYGTRPAPCNRTARLGIGQYRGSRFASRYRLAKLRLLYSHSAKRHSHSKGTSKLQGGKECQCTPVRRSSPLLW